MAGLLWLVRGRHAIAYDAKLAALEHRMTLRLGGMMMASVGAMTALLKLT